MTTTIQLDHGITLRSNDEGVWIEFKSSKGKSAAFNVGFIEGAQGNSTLIATAIQEWIADIKEFARLQQPPGRPAACPKCDVSTLRSGFIGCFNVGCPYSPHDKGSP